MPMPELTEMNCSRGAPMGRRETYCADREAPLVFEIRQVILDDDGYDTGGAYWGIGTPLWRVWGEDEDGEMAHEQYLRSQSRAEVVRYMTCHHPAATFLPGAWPLADAVTAYLNEASWVDPDCEDEDALQGDELPSAAARTEAEIDLKAFIEKAKAVPGAVEAWEAAEVGYYFWHARNGAGVGFFDHGDRPGSRELQAIARGFRARSVFRNEAGELDFDLG